MSDERYNGWTNYETWNVNLWIDNDEDEQGFWQEQAKELVEGYEGEAWPAVKDLAGRMQGAFEEQAKRLIGSHGPFVDLLGYALEHVNWREIAEHYIAEAAQEYEKEQVEDEPDDEEE